ncbi:MAG: LAGLIDADG family homing endonuclease [Candidatus Aenigmatarchaeota archaeon]
MKAYNLNDYENVVSLRKAGVQLKTISEITYVKMPTMKSWLYYGRKPKRFSEKSRICILKNLELAKSRLRELKNQKYIELSRKIDENFCYILGVIRGDGCISFRKDGGACIYLSVVDEDFAKVFYKLLKEWSGIYCRIWKYGDRWRVTQSSVASVRALKYFDSERLNHMNDSKIASFLKGMYDSEGNVSNRCIRFYNSDKKLIELVRGLLKILGIQTGRVYTRPAGNHEIGGRIFLVKPVHTLNITGRRNLELFYEKIGFSIGRKQEKLFQYLKSYKVYKINWSESELEFLAKNRHRNYHWISKQLGRTVPSVETALRKHSLKMPVDNRLLH